jgi:ABC-type uncharacterized transport system permease subunit
VILSKALISIPYFLNLVLTWVLRLNRNILNSAMHLIKISLISILVGLLKRVLGIVVILCLNLLIRHPLNGLTGVVLNSSGISL